MYPVFRNCTARPSKWFRFPDTRYPLHPTISCFLWSFRSRDTVEAGSAAGPASGLPPSFAAGHVDEATWRGDLDNTRDKVRTVVTIMERKCSINPDGSLAKLTVHSSKVRSGTVCLCFRDVCLSGRVCTH